MPGSQDKLGSLPGAPSRAAAASLGACFGNGSKPLCYTWRLGAELCAFLLLAAAGLFQAAFAVPIKHTRGWRWEQVWAAQSVTANLLFPLLWAAMVPRAFWEQCLGLPAAHWIACYAWGLLWGAGGVTYGLALARLGMAFANSFTLGVSILAGALLPLLFKAVKTPVRPLSFVAGLLLCLISTALLGWFRRHGARKPLVALSFRLDSYGLVLAIAMISGILSASYGLALSFRFETVGALARDNVSPFSASLAVLLPVYLGGASVAIPFALFWAARSHSLDLFVRPDARWNWTMACIMGLCAAGTALCYNLGSTMRGHPFPNVSFAIFMAFFVLGGVALGFHGGEMRGSRRADQAGLLLSACGLVAAAGLLNAR